MNLEFSTVRERDMDLLFLQAISSDGDFAKRVVDQTKWAGQAFEIETVALSRTEADLGESDITMIISVNGEKYGILIEDKIDAIAMPDQHGRYLKRGKKAVKAGLYQDFDCMILCPEKYYRSNEEAKRYEHSIFYEEIEAYFRTKHDPVNQVRLIQIQAAIQKAKKPPSVNLNEAANAFFSELSGISASALSAAFHQDKGNLKRLVGALQNALWSSIYLPQNAGGICGSDVPTGSRANGRCGASCRMAPSAWHSWRRCCGNRKIRSFANIGAAFEGKKAVCGNTGG